MTAQELANALLPLLERVNIPMSQGNLAAAQKIYETLGAMSKGALRFEQPPKD